MSQINAKSNIVDLSSMMDDMKLNELLLEYLGYKQPTSTNQIINIPTTPQQPPKVQIQNAPKKPSRILGMSTGNMEHVKKLTF